MAGCCSGAGVTVILFNGHLVPQQIAWRFAFGLGAVLGLGIIFLRHYVPESPRWLVILSRIILDLILMIAQAFFYNAIFFT